MFDQLDFYCGGLIVGNDDLPDVTLSAEEMRKREALRRQAAGERPYVSTGIHGYITRGYGRLDENGFWEFPLPDGEYVE